MSHSRQEDLEADLIAFAQGIAERNREIRLLRDELTRLRQKPPTMRARIRRAVSTRVRTMAAILAPIARGTWSAATDRVRHRD